VKNKIIGLSGVATCGKDTFFSLLKKECFKKYNANIIRLALADSLKEEMKEFLFEKYNIDILNCSPSEKEKVRPELVSYAKIKRQQTKGRHWINTLSNKIKEGYESKTISPSDIFCITDIRYDHYEKDEIYWLKKENSGVLVYIEKFMPGGFICPPANNDEKVNDPKLRKSADYLLSWNHGSSKKDLMLEMNKCIDFLESLDIFKTNE
jgi:hypothetical protein